MLPAPLNDEVLINMVEAGYSLRRIRTVLGYGPRFIFNRLKQLGLVDKDAPLTDCIYPELHRGTFKKKNIFSYEDFLEFRINQKLSLEDLAEKLGIDYEFYWTRLLSVDKKYNRRYKASLQKVS